MHELFFSHATLTNTNQFSIGFSWPGLDFFIIIIMSIICIWNPNLEPRMWRNRIIILNTACFSGAPIVSVELSSRTLTQTYSCQNHSCSNGSSDTIADHLPEHAMHRVELSLVEVAWPHKSGHLSSSWEGHTRAPAPTLSHSHCQIYGPRVHAPPIYVTTARISA